MKTRADVITHALVKARVVAVGETPAAEHSANALLAFDGLAAELQSYGTADGFWSNIPEHLFAPVVRVLAADIAGTYGLPSETRRQAAVVELMGLMRPDDREAVEPESF